MRVDLHIHTTKSDGAWTPEAVVRGAAQGGLDVIAITDHDTIAGFAEAAAAGHDLRVQVIPGIEVSSTHEGRDIHILIRTRWSSTAAGQGTDARNGCAR